MKLAALRVGEGPQATALVHGYLGSGRNLWSLARAWSVLDPSRTFILPDLTGHGESPPLSPNADLHSMARDLMETLRSTGLAAPYPIVGHSLGGRVALAALDLDPSSVNQVTMLDISPGEVGIAGRGHTLVAEAFALVPSTFARREDAREALAAEGLSKPMVDWLLTNLRQTGESFTWRVDRQALLGVRHIINAIDLWPIAQRFPQRIHCIRGSRSDYVSDVDAERLRQLGARVDTLEGAGHFLHVDRPRELLDLLTQPASATKNV